MLLFGVVTGLVVAEIGLQIVAVYIRRTEQPATAAWQSDRRRVICLGDSNVYGLWMERNRTWPYQLEQVWNAAVPDQPVEVLNLGFPGLNSSKLRKNFRGLLEALQPTLVLVLVGSNDINSVPVPIDEGGEADGSLRYTLWQHSRVFRLLYMLVTGVREHAVQIDVNYTAEKRHGVVRVGGAEFDLAGTDRMDPRRLGNWYLDLQKNLRAMAADAAAAGAAFVVLTYPSSHTLYGSANAVLAQMTDLRLVDLGQAFRRVCPTGECPELFLADQHPTAAGYQLAAAIVFAQLDDLGLAPESAVLPAAVATLAPSIQKHFKVARTEVR
jgi:lysophospholipase L1-like esterase